MKKIIIVGGGAVGWSVAALLRAQLPRELVAIQLIEDSRKDEGVVECASSRTHNFHDLIGLRERTCMLDAHAHFGLGFMYDNWSYQSQECMVAEGYYGASLGGVDFQHIYIKNYLSSGKGFFDDYSLSAVAAKLGRFGHPSTDAQSIYAAIKYGFHFQLDSYAYILRNHALALGVDAVLADCTSVNRNDDNGNIISLELNGLSTVAGDFFIDCTGEESVLLGSACGVARSSGDMDILFNKFAIGTRLQPSGLPSAATLTSKVDGFFKIIPLKNKEIITYYFSSDVMTENAITERLAAWGFSSIQVKDYYSYQCENFWANNCLAVGHSGARFFDLLVSPLQHARNAIVRFLDLFVDFDTIDASRYEFNRLSHIELDNIKEVIELHLYTSQYQSVVSADYFSTHKLSPSASHRLNLFLSNGRHVHSDLHLLTDMEWAAFFMGNKIVPESYSYDVDFLDEQSIHKFMEKLKSTIFESAHRIPRHADYIKGLSK